MSVKFSFKGLAEPFEAIWPVTVLVPQDGGTVEEQVFNARFRMLTKEEVEAVQADTDADAYHKAFFVGIPAEDLDGEPFEAVQGLMLSQPYVRIALIKAYTGFQAGIAVKNS